MLSVSFVFVFHVSPPAVRVGLGRGSQPIDETLGLGRRCTESLGVCLRCAILGDIQHIFRKKSAVMAERDGVDESVVEVLRDCVLLLVRELYPNPVGVPYLGHKWW